MTKIRTEITHTPSYISLHNNDSEPKTAYLEIDDFIESPAGHIDLAAPLRLSLLQTEEEFKQALLRSGVIQH